MTRPMRLALTSSGEDEPMSQPGSFEAFFEAERDGLFGALVLITGDRHEAEESAQDAFLVVWERWDHVSGMENELAALLCGAAG